MAARQRVVIDLRQVDRQAERDQQRVLPLGKRLVDAAQPFGQSRGAQHADRHGFAVQQLAVAGHGFQGVAKRVAVVEHRPQAGLFAFVGLDDVGLQPATAGDDVLAARRRRGRSISATCASR